MRKFIVFLFFLFSPFIIMAHALAYTDSGDKISSVQAKAYFLDQESYNINEPIYILSLEELSLNQVSFVRHVCASCDGAAPGECPCDDIPITLEGRKVGKKGSYWLLEFKNNLGMGYYLVKIKGSQSGICQLSFKVNKRFYAINQELSLETDKQVYLPGESAVYKITNLSDKEVYILEGCDSTVLRYRLQNSQDGTWSDHVCIAKVPLYDCGKANPYCKDAKIALTLAPRQQVALTIRLPFLEEARVVPFISYKRCKSYQDYLKNYSTIDNKFAEYLCQEIADQIYIVSR